MPRTKARNMLHDSNVRTSLLVTMCASARPSAWKWGANECESCDLKYFSYVCLPLSSRADRPLKAFQSLGVGGRRGGVSVFKLLNYS